MKIITKSGILFCISLGMLLASCDDGKIYPQQEQTLNLEINLTITSCEGITAWPIQYKLYAACLDNEENPNILAKTQIAKPSAEGVGTDVTISYVPEQTDRIGIVITGKDEQSILYSYYTKKLDQSEGTLNLKVEKINLASFDRIQKQIFTSDCATCHNQSDNAPRKLHLYEGMSYASLMNEDGNGRYADAAPETLLVEPGNAENSFLYQMVTVKNILSQDHKEMLEAFPEMRTLLQTWMNRGAPND